MKQREHVAPIDLGLTENVPQWSPPSDGRSTAPFAAMITCIFSPRWGPPLNGRRTRAGRQPGDCCTACRNGARR